MPINPLDIAAGRYMPQAVDVISPFFKGKERVAKMGAQDVGAKFFQGDPGVSRGDLLAQLSQVDPFKAAQISGKFDKAKVAGSGKQSVFEQRQEAMQGATPIRKAYDAKFKETSQRLSENPNLNISTDLAELSSLNNQYFELTQKALPGSRDLRTALRRLGQEIRQKMAEKKHELSEEKFKFDVSEEDEQDLKVDVKDSTRNLKAFSEMAMLANKATDFIELALQGNPVASKNLMAATSRLASNEALSDTELTLVLSGNLKDVLDREWNKLAGTGAKIDLASVKAAAQQVQNLRSKWTSNLDKKLKKVTKRIAKANPKYTEEEVKNRVLMLVSEGEQGKYSGFNTGQ